jgi:uncharacterized protein (TIGR02217 family)
MSFHDVRFPLDISLGAIGGPEQRTEIITLASGFEERNARWADARYRFNVGYGIKTLDQLQAFSSFFLERQGRLHGFRFRDWADYKSCPPQQTPKVDDQRIGTGDGVTSGFLLVKTYGGGGSTRTRTITKPVAGSVLVAVDGALQSQGTDYDLDALTGLITFVAGHIPAAGAIISAGYEFDVPVRFDMDHLQINTKIIGTGLVGDIPVVEVRS